MADPFRSTDQYKRYGVLLARIDDRLVHGQVVVGWNQVVRAKHIVVCSDRAAGDEFERAIVEAASAPADLSVRVYGLGETARALSEGAFLEGGVILLFEGPADALRLINAGITLDRVNVGGMHQKPGKSEAAVAVWLDDRDGEVLRALVATGARVTAQMVPSEAALNIEFILDRMAASSDG